MIKKSLFTILVFALGAASATGVMFGIEKFGKKNDAGPVAPVVSVEVEVETEEMLSSLSVDELEQKALEAGESGDIEMQRLALIELHKKHPSEEYLDAISAVPVEINDNMALRLVGEVLNQADAGEINTAMDLLNSKEWKEAFVDDLVGTTRISVYNMGQRIVPVAAAGVTPSSQKLQIRIEANEYGAMIKYLNGDGSYQYLHMDGAGLQYMKATVKDGAFDSDFVKASYNTDGEAVEVISGTFEKGKLTGDITVEKKGKTQKAKITKDYDIATVLGVEGYTDFTSFVKVQLSAVTLETFEEKMVAQLDEKNKQKTESEITGTTSITDSISEFKSSTTTTASANTGSSNSKTNTTTSKSNTTANTPVASTPEPSNDDDNGSSDDGGGYSEPDPTPAPDPEPEPPADTNEESTEQEGSVGGESGFYD